jgi:hypothetical protein
MKSTARHNYRPETTSSARYRNLLNGVFCFVCALVLSIVSAEAGLAQPRLVQTRVDGLPAGLTVGFVGRVTQCTQNGITFPLVGNVNLTEQTTTSFETVVLPGGQISLRQVTHTAYVGEMAVVLPGNNGCGAGTPTNTFVFAHTVLGQNNGLAMARFANGQAFLTGSPFQINRTIEAKTTSILENTNVPTTLNKGVFHRLTVNYQDAFGMASISTPSLDITQPGLVFGMPTTFSFGKIFITDARNVCLRVNGSTVCRALSQGGLLTNGAVTVDVGGVSDVQVDSFNRLVGWRFRLEPTFATGDFQLIAAADDADPDEYVVDGQPTALNLLSWKSLKLAVDVN